MKLEPRSFDDGVVHAWCRGQKKPGAETVDWLFLALAHAKAGNGIAAKGWLDKAAQRIDAVKNASVPETAAEWAAQFEERLLRAEAAALFSR